MSAPVTLIADFQSLMLPAEDFLLGGRQRGAEAVDERACDEQMLVSAYRKAHDLLIGDIIGHIHAQPPEFFEELVIDVLLAVGYGSRRRDLASRIGKTGDGGIDGLIAQDELGLDLIYLQAKRFKPGNTVPVSDVRDFVGSLDARHASKGIFLSTSHFSTSALEFCGQVTRRVVLVDGKQLAELMIKHNVGVKVKQSFQFKRIDRDYFCSSQASRTREMISASIQPRR